MWSPLPFLSYSYKDLFKKDWNSKFSPLTQLPFLLFKQYALYKKDWNFATKKETAQVYPKYSYKDLLKKDWNKIGL